MVVPSELLQCLVLGSFKISVQSKHSTCIYSKSLFNANFPNTLFLNLYNPIEKFEEFVNLNNFKVRFTLNI